jgi:hypothetical protein
MDEYRKVTRAGLAMLVGMFIALTLLLWAFATAATQPDEFDTTTVAVAIIDAQMEQTRRQVVFYDVDEARQACADAAWRPAMHHAVRALRADPVFADTVDKWVQAWGDGLVDCYRGDMANASTGIARAYELKETMTNRIERQERAR